MPTKGFEQVKSNLRKTFNDVADKQVDVVFAILFQGSEISKLMTPMDVGTLVNSLYAPRVISMSGKVTGTVGYTAMYAKAVHDAPGTLKGLPRKDFGKTRNGQTFGGGTGKGNYWDPTGEPKFLYKGFEQIKPSIPRIQKEYGRVK